MQESYLQLSLMADAEDEGLLLTRQVDSEDVDISQIAPFVSQFVNKISALFGGSVETAQCWTVPGYTKYALQLLSRPQVFFVGNETKTLGGPGHPSKDVCQRCLARMQAWVRLARQVVKSEFPTYEVVLSFGLFNLAEDCRRTRMHLRELKAIADQDPAVTTELERHCRRLGKVINVDPDQLQAQFLDHRCLAQRHFRKPGATTFGAWRQSLKDTQARPCVRKAHPADALHPVLVRFGTYVGATSGVEHGHGECRQT
jgi:hypothetical protein